MSDRPRRRAGLQRSLVLLLLGLGTIGVTGCADTTTPSADTAAGEVPKPQPPAYLQLTKDLGIWQALQASSMTFPLYLYFVPGVDGEGPFDVEFLADVPFRDTPQRTLTMNIHRPKTDDGKLRRGVVLYAGGGFLADDDFQVIEAWAVYLASRGVVAFNTRQRLITEADVKVTDVVSDAIAAFRFAAAHAAEYGADPGRLGTLGRSSGGQIALLVGMLPDPDRFRAPGDADAPIKVGAMVNIFGPVDYARLLSGEDFTVVAPDEILSVMGGTPEQVPDVYKLMSPLTYVRPGLPPIMLVHGSLDLTVPISQTIELADRLEAAGDSVQREFFLETGHVLGWGLLNNDGFGRAMVQIIPFLEAHL